LTVDVRGFWEGKPLELQTIEHPQPAGNKSDALNLQVSSLKRGRPKTNPPRHKGTDYLPWYLEYKLRERMRQTGESRAKALENTLREQSRRLEVLEHVLCGLLQVEELPPLDELEAFSARVGKRPQARPASPVPVEEQELLAALQKRIETLRVGFLTEKKRKELEARALEAQEENLDPLARIARMKHHAEQDARRTPAKEEVKRPYRKGDRHPLEVGIERATEALFSGFDLSERRRRELDQQIAAEKRRQEEIEKRARARSEEQRELLRLVLGKHPKQEAQPWGRRPSAPSPWDSGKLGYLATKRRQLSEKEHERRQERIEHYLFNTRHSQDE